MRNDHKTNASIICFSKLCEPVLPCQLTGVERGSRSRFALDKGNRLGEREGRDHEVASSAGDVPIFAGNCAPSTR